jgi:uncharacterized damage-inducible protein DinB
MNLLDRLLGHDAWTTRQLLLRCRELSEEQFDRPFEIGNRSLRATFVHMLECMELHTDRMLARPERELPEDYAINALLERLTVASKELAELALNVDRTGTEDVMWLGGGGKKRTLGGGIVHLITHNMHHRAQALSMMEQLGLEDVIEGDALGWESVARGWGWSDGGSYGRPTAE